MNALLRNSIFVFVAALLTSFALAAPQSSARRNAPWTPQQIALAESLPVQDGGRIKPLGTLAGFTLLRMHGKRSIKTPDAEKLAPVAWFLDVLFYPEQAADYPTFLVEDSDAITAIGLPIDGKKKRDWYSFNELHRGHETLAQLANDYSRIEEKQRTSIQNQVVMLAVNLRDYSDLAAQAAFARASVALPACDALAQLFPNRTEARFSELTAKMPELATLQEKIADDPARTADQAALRDVLMAMSELIGSSQALAFLPPSGSVEAQPEWLSPFAVVMQAFETGKVDAEHVAMLAGVEGMASALQDTDAQHASLEFTRNLSALSTRAQALSTARGEYEKVGLEVSYYKADLLYWALVIFVFAFLGVALTWLMPKSSVLYVATAALTAAPIALVIAAIVMRCMIRGRPPVSTLYETVLFVTATGALTALVTEAINKKRIALSAAVIMGLLGLFVANGYETLDKQDTMPSLVAVLDTNFWLATHVTAITIGYSAGMLAALLACAYLVRKLAFWAKPNPDFARTMTRMVYGVLCFGLIFSTVGTILGGVWANESWGRFWGWDPKENGALLIVLSQIVILHARMGGYLREFGIHMATAFGGTVVAFSWFGVNLLGVGLHSYGFTSGISNALNIYYLATWGLMAAAAGVHLVQLSNTRTA